MKLSLKWLNNFLELDDTSPEEVASKLTMGAFEVEEIQKVGAKLKGPIVVSKILDIQKHPNADRLLVATVTTDGKNKLQIVCGAKNIRTGQLVPLALSQAIVVNRKDGSQFLIQKTKIREVESSGMLCSPAELGLEDKSREEGILILPENAKLGQDIIEFLNLEEDTVLEVASRSNRPDGLSVYGLAREISALTGKKLKNITFCEPKISPEVRIINPKIENQNETFLFYTCTIEDIKVQESPNWLKYLLNSCGIRSVNNTVDITNYINFSFGQPLHAYDLEKLTGDFLEARSAKSTEKITTIDGKTRELKEQVLVIADKKGPQAIAGIMGGKETEVGETTKAIVLEAASFSQHKVRRASREIGLTSEASKRFERGVDSVLTYKALLKAIELILETAKENNKQPKAGKIQQAGKPQYKELKIILPTDLIQKVLNINLQAHEISLLLERLNFTTNVTKQNNLEVIVPPSRASDITRPIDLVEEVARVYGYDKIPAQAPGITIISSKSLNLLEKVKEYWTRSGFSETYLSSLVGEAVLKNDVLPVCKQSLVSMVNPLSREHAVLRQVLFPSLVEALKTNQSHGINLIRLFELGKVYFYDNKAKTTSKETGVTEKLKLAGVASGFNEAWIYKDLSREKKNELLFFNVKGILEGFLSKFTDVVTVFSKTQESFLHPNFSLKITLEDLNIGVFGILHPSLEKKLELSGPVIIFEIYLEPVLNQFEKTIETKRFIKISSTPVVERDITIDLDKEVPANLVTLEINKIKQEFTKSIELVNTYELNKDTKSLTYRLKMQGLKQTLTSKEVEDEVNKIIKHITSCFKAKFRV